MEKLHTAELVSSKHGETHLVNMNSLSSLPGWLIHTQIELDGNRVFVRRVDTNITSGTNPASEVFGIIVSPVY